jgi:hypothetical protein
VNDAHDPAAVMLPRQTKGKRPLFFADPATDQVMTFVLELATELAVVRTRLDTVERLLDEHGSVTRAAIDAYEPGPAVEAERDAWLADYYRRVLRMHAGEAPDPTED